MTIFYCDLPTIKSSLGIETNTDDDLLSGFATQAQGIIDAYCQRSFAALTDSTRYFDAARDVDGQLLVLDSELARITSITNGDSVLIDDDDYVTEPRNQTPFYGIRLKASSSIAWTYTDSPENAIVIVGRWAYGVNPPQAIVQAHKRLAMWLYRQKSTSADSDRVIISGDGTVILPATFPKDVTGTLELFKRRWL